MALRNLLSVALLLGFFLVGSSALADQGSVLFTGSVGLIGYTNGTVFQLPGGLQCNGLNYFNGYSYCASQHNGGQLLRAKGVEYENMTVVNSIPLPNAHLVVINERYAFVSDVDFNIWKVTLSNGYTRKFLSLNNTRGMFFVGNDSMLSAGDQIARSTRINSDFPYSEILVQLSAPSGPNAGRLAYDVLQLGNRIMWTEECGIWSCNLTGGDIKSWKKFPCPADKSIFSGPYFFYQLGKYLYWTRGIRYTNMARSFFERAPLSNASAVEVLFESFKYEWFYDVFYLPPGTLQLQGV
jgi:hypothetical protein